MSNITKLERAFAAASYFFLFSLFIKAYGRKNAFVSYHADLGVRLAVIAAFAHIFRWAAPFIGYIGFIIAALSGAGVYFALTGQEKSAPFIGKIPLRLPKIWE